VRCRNFSVLLHKNNEGFMNSVADVSGIMAGKRGLVMGVANERSIAWGISAAAAAQGAELAFTYQGDALKKRVEPLAASIGSSLVMPCDVTDEASMMPSLTS
jgi:enoyl-[acyl-carrier protein] reductase I